MAEFRCALTLPSHPDAATLARATVRELTSLSGLPADQADALVLAATEACDDIVRYALAPGAQEALDLVGVVTPRALTLMIRERGAPFDPARPRPTTTGDALSSPIPGPAWDRLRAAVDEAHWSCRGNAGMELHLTKYRRQGEVTALLPEAELVPFDHDEPLAPDQSYTVRRFRPEDAVGVAQCVYRSFLYSYGGADLYYPDRIVHLNETGQLVSFVALDDAGAVVGHLGLERPDLGPIAESSDAAVAPAHRHRHLLERLRTCLEEEAGRLGLEGIVGYPVTSHPFSQRMEETFHGRACAVVLGQLPRSTSFPGISEPARQRVSTMLYFKYLAAPPPSVLYAPPRHRSMLERIYAQLDVPAELRAPVAASGPGRLTVTFDRSWGCGEIHVEGVGIDTAAEVRRARQDLCAVADAEVVYLYLPLAQGGTPELCLMAEADGFFFSGVGPRFAPDGDALCLQYVRGEFDTGVLEVASPLGKELLDYAAAERARVQG